MSFFESFFAILGDFTSSVFEIYPGSLIRLTLPRFISPNSKRLLALSLALTIECSFFKALSASRSALRYLLFYLSSSF